MPEHLRVLDFWFRELTPRQWFGAASAELDASVRARFGALLDAAKHGAHDDWAATPRGRLALIVVLDQFSRHVHRDTPEAYAADGKAQALARDGVAAGMDEALTIAERQFFYMPFMHAEDAELQAFGFARFTALNDDAKRILSFAEGHRSIVERFGRFPHRNAILGRPSTEAEQAFLDSPESETF